MSTRITRSGWLAPHSPWQLALGFTLWSAWFVTVYGGLSVGCAVAPDAFVSGRFTGLSGLLMALTVAMVLLLLLASAHCLLGWRRLRALQPQPGRNAQEDRPHAMGKAVAARTPARNGSGARDARSGPHADSNVRCGDVDGESDGDEDTTEDPVRDRAARRQFVSALAALLHAAAAVATAFVGLPMLWFPPCL